MSVGSTKHGPVAFTEGHHFELKGTASVEDLAAAATVPLSVILQVTKRCNFDCTFCSETLQLPDPTLADLERIRDNLSGVQRVFLSGGEPLLRRDFGEIVDLYSDFIVGVPTNATRGLQHAKNLVGKVAFVNVGLEGPRSTTNRVRGDYDQVMAGVRAFLEHGLPISLSAVVYRSTLHALPYTYQIADVLGAGKLKLILPLRKGNALDLEEHEFISHEEAAQTFDRLTELRAGVVAAREAWHGRRDEPVPARQVIDTRYDSGHILKCQSRRLVDVCTSLHLDVSQPELRGISMTALHREWLQNRDEVVREWISVLNLRHSLSTALVALRAAGRGTWDGTLNVNRLLRAQLEGTFEWFGSPAFSRLV